MQHHLCKWNANKPLLFLLTYDPMRIKGTRYYRKPIKSITNLLGPTTMVGMFTNLNRRFFKGALFVAVLSFTFFMGTIVIMGPTLILLWLRPRWFRWINDRLMVIWLTLPPVRLIYLFLYAFFFRLYCAMYLSALLMLQD